MFNNSVKRSFALCANSLICSLFGSFAASAESVNVSKLENLFLENSLNPPICSIKSRRPELTTLSKSASLYFLSKVKADWLTEKMSCIDDPR